VLGDDYGVFVVSGEAAVGGADGPAVAVEGDAAGAGSNDGLDGDDETFGEEMAGGGVSIIGDAGGFVDGAAYAMATQFADDVETAAADFALDGATDIFGAVAGAGSGEGLSEGAFGAVGEFAGFFLCGRDLDGYGGVGVVAVFYGGEIEFDEVAGLDGARAGDAVDHFVVDADADVAGKIVDERWGGLCAVFFKDVRGDRGEFSRGNPGTDGGGHGPESFGDDEATGAKFLEFFWGVDRHGLQRSTDSGLRQKRDDHEEQGSDDRVLVRFRSIP
jgi:hypothetical protein